MAVRARYTEQIPVVCTPDQRALLEADADSDGISLAAVVRRALDTVYGLEDGMLPEGDPRQRPADAVAAQG